MYGQQQPQCPVRSKCNVDANREKAPKQTIRPGIGKFFKSLPLYSSGFEFFFHIGTLVIDIVVYQPGFPHHLKEIGMVFGRMRIFFGIGKGVVHAVHYAIAISTQVIGAHKKPSEDIEKFFPAPAHCKLLVRGIAVQKKTVNENAEVPLHNKKYKYDHFRSFLTRQVKCRNVTDAENYFKNLMQIPSLDFQD